MVKRCNDRRPIAGRGITPPQHTVKTVVTVTSPALTVAGTDERLNLAGLASMQKTGIHLPFLCGLQPWLLFLALVFCAPLANAHEGHHDGGTAVANHHALASDLSLSSDPCGNGGGPCRCADGQLCVSPDLTKLPVLPPARPWVPGLTSVHELIASAPVHLRPRILIAAGAPRAPPFSQ